MANQGGDNFYLDLKQMDAIIDQVQTIAKTMEETKENYRRDITRLTAHWTGVGRNTFDKKANQLIRTMKDISKSFFEIGEDLLTASEAYMQADTDAAKQLAGKDSRF